MQRSEVPAIKQGNYGGVWAISSQDASSSYSSSDWNRDIGKSSDNLRCSGYTCSSSSLYFDMLRNMGLDFNNLVVRALLNVTDAGKQIHDSKCYSKCSADLAPRNCVNCRPRGHYTPHHNWYYYVGHWIPKFSTILHWALITTIVVMIVKVLRRWRMDWKEKKRQEAQESKVAYFSPTSDSVRNAANPTQSEVLPPLYIIPPPQYSVHSNIDAVNTDTEKSDANQLKFV